MKICSKCSKVKKPNLFYKGKGQCKDCIKGKQKENRDNITDSYCTLLLKRQKEQFDPIYLETNIMIKRLEVTTHRFKKTLKQMKTDRL